MILAETIMSFESIAYLLALAAVLFFQQRAAATAKAIAEKAAEAAAAAHTAKEAIKETAVEIKAIKDTTESTAATVAVVHKLSNGTLGAALNATALSARLLANALPDKPEYAVAADLAELAASNHAKKELEVAIAANK